MYAAILIVIIIVFILIALYKNAPQTIGSFGENKVASELCKLNSEEYLVINDVLIKKDGFSSQIDHIVISKYGIFVIETKNYSGWIHGNDNSEYWTQTIYKMKSKFRNPVKQNWSHIYALKNILNDYKYIKYYPIVVFAGSAEFKNIYSRVPVVYKNQLIQTILNNNTNPHLNIEQVHNIANTINEFKTHNIKENYEHINHVRHMVYKHKENEEQLICPKCGSSLIVRNGKYGMFYGCSGFPRCKYTLNIKRR